MFEFRRKFYAIFGSLVLVGCSTPEPVLVRPNIIPSLFECKPAPPRPENMTVNDIFDRNDEWANAFDNCQCRLWVVQDLINDEEIHPCVSELQE